MLRLVGRWIRGGGGRSAGRRAGAVLLASACLALAPAAGVLARPAASRALTPAEVEQAAGLPAGVPFCARRTLTSGVTMDTCGYALGGTDLATAPGVVSVLRMTAYDPPAQLLELFPAGGAPAAGLGDPALWSSEATAGSLKVLVATVVGDELIATEVAWQRNAPGVPATRDLAIELTRLTLAP